MNPLGALAQQWYQQYLPQAYQGITSPEEFFQTLGEQAGQEIEQVATALAGPDQPGEAFNQKLGRLQQAQEAATELVMRTTLLALLPPQWPDSDYPLPATPDPSIPPAPDDPAEQALTEAMMEFSDAVAELAAQNRAPQASDPVLPPKPESLTTR